MKRLLLGLTLAVALVSGCSDKDDKGDKKGKFIGMAAPSPFANQLRIVGPDGQGLAGAQILIGSEIGKPFAENFITSGEDGGFLAPEAWTEELPVTIQAPGYIRVTYFGQKPQGQNFALRAVEGAGAYELQGITTGFQVANGDGLVDFGLSIPAFKKSEIFTLDLASLVSSQNDVITVIGQKVEIPSNISLPNQRESYFLPITLDKNSYRMYFRSPGTKKVATLRGKFPLKEVVDGIRAEQGFLELINYFSIQGGSLKTVNIKNKKTEANLPVNEINFVNSRRMTAPDFRDSVFAIGVSFSETQGILFPTDFKQLSPGQSQALQTGPGDALVGTVLKYKSETESGQVNDRVSVTLLPFKSGTAPTNLPLIENPRLLSGTHVQIPSVKPIRGVRPTGTYANLSSVESVAIGVSRVEQLRTVWEVYAPGWASDVQLPVWPKAAAAAGKMRWGVTLIGQSETVPGGGELGPGTLENSTHATHSSVDF